jgi:hypothetical protein
MFRQVKTLTACSTCALNGRRAQERRMLAAVKQLVAEMLEGWMLFTEWPLHKDDYKGYVDCMLVHEEGGMVAVEFDGTSHRQRPPQYGLEPYEALQVQHEYDQVKAEILHARSVRLERVAEASNGEICLRGLRAALCCCMLQHSWKADAENIACN